MSFSEPFKFSAVMCIYANDYIETTRLAIESVLSQSLKATEFLVILDGPVEKELYDYLCSLGDAIIMHQLPCNVGLAEALNYALTKVTTNWLARCDADDINSPCRFEKQVNFLKENPSIHVVGTQICEVYDDGDRFLKLVPIDDDAILKYATLRSPFNHMTVFMDVEKINSIGGYPNIYLKEDYALWLNCIKHSYNLANLTDVCVTAKAGKSMIGRRGGYRYLLSEVVLQRYAMKIGMRSVFLAVVLVLLKLPIIISPVFVRKLVYLKLLRKRNSG